MRQSSRARPCQKSRHQAPDMFPVSKRMAQSMENRVEQPCVANGTRSDCMNSKETTLLQGEETLQDQTKDGEIHALEERDSWNKAIRIRNKMRSHDCLIPRQAYLTIHEMGRRWTGTNEKDGCCCPF
jgi:hypothetical protein